jgi:hypothetical protein
VTRAMFLLDARQRPRRRSLTARQSSETPTLRVERSAAEMDIRELGGGNG